MSAPSKDRLARLLKHTQVRLAERTSVALSPLGINGRELAVLIEVADGPPSSQSEIGRRMGADRTTMVALIDGLEDKGLVERRPDPDDRRRNVAVLTRRGKSTTRRGATAIEKVEASFLADLPDGDVAALRRALKRLAE